jgi:hypothetical protein
MQPLIPESLTTALKKSLPTVGGKTQFSKTLHPIAIIPRIAVN